VPRIQTETLAEQREWRRSQLIDAAASIALELGGQAITVAAVAQRAGLSRTSVYEYFASSADLVADLVIEELDGFTNYLADEVGQCSEPRQSLEAWIRGALTYSADGRHLLAKALNSTALPDERVHQIRTAHRALLVPLINSLEALKVVDVNRALEFIQAVTNVSTKRIEAGQDAKGEIDYAIAFCTNGLASI
jgi:AcrR family transcriptional regulator